MKTFNINGITGAIVLDTRNQTKEKKYAVKYRVTYNRIRHYFASGIYLTENEWEEIERPRNKLNKLLDVLNPKFDLIEKVVKDIQQQGLGFSIDYLKKLINKGTQKTLSDYFDYKIQLLDSANQVGTSDIYKLAKNSILEFAKRETIRPNEITIDFLQDYEQWMLKRNRGYTTIGIYLRQLRSVLNIAKKNLDLNEISYPFGKDKYEIPNSKGTKKALSINQIKDVTNCKLRNNSKDEFYRDIWFFSYLANGLNIYDICKLKYSNIEDGEIILYRQKTYRTSKTKKQISIILLPELLSIIDKWGNIDKNPSNYIFPFFSPNLTPKLEKSKVKTVTKSVNKCFKFIAKNNDAIGKITTYTARHSYATVLKRSGANIAYISESLGHSDLKTTENYLASFEKDERIKNAKLLLNF